jgi:tetratricopeptide (TPR) repeat protein
MMLSPSRSVPKLAALLDQAIERDPNFGPALAVAATFHMNSDLLGWTDDPEANREKGLERGRRALQVAGDDPAILANVAFALTYFGEDINPMMALVDRALSLNPSFARAWHASGCLRLWAGQPHVAIEHIENSLRLSPRSRVGWGLIVIAAAHFISRRFDEAIPKLLLSIEEDPTGSAYQFLIASYAHSGKLDDARHALDRLRSLGPVSAGNVSAFRNPEHRELLLSGLRLAAGEDA